MGLIRLAIAASDGLYSQKLAEYIVHNHSCIFEVSCCSTLEALNRRLTEGRLRADALLIDEELLVYADKGLLPQTTILLSENRNEAGDNSIFKYRRASEIVAEIIRGYSRNNENCRLPYAYEDRPKIAAVCSPSGGTGKSTFAVCLGIQCAQRGMSALYLSLERTPSTSCFFPDSYEFNMSNVLYALKDNSVSLDAAVEAASEESLTNGLYYISPADNAEDLREMSSEDLERLIFTLAERGKYDVILIDTDSGTNPLNTIVMEVSDVVFAVLGEGPVAEEKNRCWGKEINLYSKVNRADILEKTTPIACPTFTEREQAAGIMRFCGKPVNERLPFYPALQRSASHEVLSCPDSQYVRRVMELSVTYLPCEKNRAEKEAGIDRRT